MLNIIKHKSLRQILKLCRCNGAMIVNKCFFDVSRILPLRNQCIVLESEGDCCDNAYALFDYIKSNEIGKRYKIIWLVDHPINFKSDKDVLYISKSDCVINGRRSYYLAISKYYFYDHCNVYNGKYKYKKRRNQMNIYLSHGWGYKASKGTRRLNYDYITVTGEIPAKGMATFWSESPNKSIITGYPRLDYLFKKDSYVAEIVNKEWEFEKYNKILFWLPTFRKSINTSLDDTSITSETGLPLLYTYESIELINAFLNQHNILIFLKIHHLQARLPVFEKRFSNIVIITDDDLQRYGIQLYQLIGFADAMISDYSSAAIDYLIMDRPIIYTLDDYEEYGETRGFVPSNAIDFMPGYHVCSVGELEASIVEISDGLDRYKKDRDRVIDEYHTYKDGNSAQRILDRFGVE